MIRGDQGTLLLHLAAQLSEKLRTTLTRTTGLHVCVVGLCLLVGATGGAVAATDPTAAQTSIPPTATDGSGGTAPAATNASLSCRETPTGAVVENSHVRYSLSGDADSTYVGSLARYADDGETVPVVAESDPIALYLFSHGERYRFESVVNASLRRPTTTDGTDACVYNVTRRYEAPNGRDDAIVARTTTALLAGQPGATTRIAVTNVGSDAADVRLPGNFVETGIRLGTIRLADHGSNYRFYIPGNGLTRFENTSYWSTFPISERQPATAVFDGNSVLAFGFVDGSTPPIEAMTEDADRPRENSDSLTFDVEGLDLEPGDAAAWTVGTATFATGLGVPDVSAETLGKAKRLTRSAPSAPEPPVSISANGSETVPGGTATLSVTVSNDGSTATAPAVRLPELPASLSVRDVTVDAGRWDSTESTWTIQQLAPDATAAGTAVFDVPARVPPGAYEVPVVLSTANDTTSTSATVTVTRPPDVTVSERAIQFGRLTVGESRTREVTLRNDGESELSVEGATVVGADRSAFEVASDDEFTLAPGASRRLSVTLDPDASGAKSAVLQVATNDPDEPVVDVWLTNTETRVEMTRKEHNGTASVNVTMENVAANSSHSMHVGSAAETDDEEEAGGQSTTLTSLNFTTAADASQMRMNVSQSERALSSSPATPLSNGTQALNYFSVDHSVSNEAIASVNVTVQIRRSKITAMNDTDPDEVALYRHVDGEWQEVPTTLVGQTTRYYRYRGSADGFSEWATGAKQPQFRITQAQVNVSAVQTGRTVLVRVRITNEGGADGQFDTDLLVNETAVASRQVSIASGGTRQVTFERAFEDAGRYEVHVNDRFAGEVEVTGGDGEPDSDRDAGSLPVVPIAAGAAVVVAALVGGLLYRRRD